MSNPFYQRDSRPKTQSLEAECSSCGHTFEERTKGFYKFESKDGQGRSVTRWRTKCEACGGNAYAIEEMEYSRPVVDPKTYKPTKQVAPNTKVIEGDPDRRPADLNDELTKKKMYKILRTCGAIENNWSEEDFDLMVEHWLEDMKEGCFAEKFFNWLDAMVSMFAEDLDSLNDIWDEETLAWFEDDIQNLDREGALEHVHSIIEDVEEHTTWNTKGI